MAAGSLAALSVGVPKGREGMIVWLKRYEVLGIRK